MGAGGGSRRGRGEGGRVPPAALCAVLAAALVAVPLLPSRGSGQAPRSGVSAETLPAWSLSVRGGFSSPKGDLGDLSDDGQLVALALRHQLTPRAGLMFEASLENLERGGRPRTLQGIMGPDIELWRGMLFLTVDLLHPRFSRWEIVFQAGAGGTIVAASEFGADDAFVAVEPTGASGVTAGYDLTRTLTLFVRGDIYLWYDGVNPGDENYLGKEVVLTHTLGLRFGL